MNKITVTAAGAPGSWIRAVQENPQLALDALWLLEAWYRGDDSARTRELTEKYLLDNKRITPLTHCPLCSETWKYSDVRTSRDDCCEHVFHSLRIDNPEKPTGGGSVSFNLPIY